MSLLYNAQTLSQITTMLSSMRATTSIHGSCGQPLQRVGGARAIAANTTERLIEACQFLQRCGYNDLSRAEKLGMLLNWGCDSGRVRAQAASYLTFSPFGWHGMDFLNLLVAENLPFNDNDQEVHIASFGGGLHNWYGFIVASLAASEHDTEAVEKSYSALKQAQLKLYGAGMATSYEPRELLALFLRGNRLGTVTVIDCLDEIKEDLKRPTFTRLNVGELVTPDKRQASVLRFYWDVLSRGRSIRTENHDSMYGSQLKSLSFEFTGEEMEKLRFIGADLMLGAEQVQPHSFDLSLWLEGLYFIPKQWQPVVMATIVDSTKIGGFVLFDFSLGPEIMNYLGLNPIISMKNFVNRPEGEGQQFAFLYQRVEETSGQRKLMEAMGR